MPSVLHVSLISSDVMWLHLLDWCMLCRAEYPKQQQIETTKKDLTKLLEVRLGTQLLSIPAQHLIV